MCTQVIEKMRPLKPRRCIKIQQERSDSGESCSVEEGGNVFIVVVGNEKKAFYARFYRRMHVSFLILSLNPFVINATFLFPCTIVE